MKKINTPYIVYKPDQFKLVAYPSGTLIPTFHIEMAKEIQYQKHMEQLEKENKES